MFFNRKQLRKGGKRPSLSKTWKLFYDNVRGISASEVEKIIFSLCKTIDSPYSLGVWLLVKYKQYDQLIEQSITPENYLQHDTFVFSMDYMLSVLLTKYSFNNHLLHKLNTKQKAIESFIENERLSRNTLRRLKTFESLSLSREVESILFLAQRKVGNLIGYLPEHHVFSDLASWGPGVTKSIKGNNNTHLGKLTEFPVRISESAWQFHSNMVSQEITYLNTVMNLDTSGPCCPLKENYIFDEVASLVFVPKNAKTDRCITVEPTGNVYCQMAIGRYLRSRLMYVGVDLTDQTRNQELAKDAINKHLATIDLSSASDSITFGLIDRLFPIQWADLLYDLALHSFEIEDHVYPSARWAGMGNATVFPVETLIFWALTSSCCEISHISDKDISVYGDDIICPREVVPLLKRVMEFCGFRLNEKKTHTDGLFFESCGKHYFNGVDVTPIYIRSSLNHPLHFVHLYNSIYRWGNNVGSVVFDKTLKYIRSLFDERINKDFNQPEDIESDFAFIESEDYPFRAAALSIQPRKEHILISDSEAYHFYLWFFRINQSFPDDHVIRFDLTNLSEVEFPISLVKNNKDDMDYFDGHKMIIRPFKPTFLVKRIIYENIFGVWTVRKRKE